MLEDRNKVFGILFIRLLIGSIFFMQGFGKVFLFGLNNVYVSAFEAYEELLPVFLLKIVLYFTSFSELIGGLFLIIGLLRIYTIIALATVLIIVSIGHGMLQPIWDLQHVVFRALLLIPLFFLPNKWDKIHTDHFIYKKKQ